MNLGTRANDESVALAVFFEADQSPEFFKRRVLVWAAWVLIEPRGLAKAGLGLRCFETPRRRLKASPC
ncbi:MAG: hypothetical protein DVB28_001887 [Verrucomicrobia bacterium]|nr:MAG: hypothetical protein DVB28_001887 [Verrucomicrobiota bacterium]